MVSGQTALSQFHAKVSLRSQVLPKRQVLFIFYCKLNSNLGITANNASNCLLDVNECTASNGDCSHKCVNTPGGYKCECPDPELSLASDNKTCHGKCRLKNHNNTIKTNYTFACTISTFSGRFVNAKFYVILHVQRLLSFSSTILKKHIVLFNSKSLNHNWKIFIFFTLMEYMTKNDPSSQIL